jgi:C4-type Zn-finger protein
MNKKIMKQAGLGEQVKLVEQKKCPFCKKEVNQSDFRNEISRRVYLISGLCQKCQDMIFGKD